MSLRRKSWPLVELMKNKFIPNSIACLFGLFCAFLVSVQAATPKKVLVVTVTKGFRHSSIPTAEKILGELGQKSGAFTVEYVRNDQEMAEKMTSTAQRGVPERNQVRQGVHRNALGQ